MEFTKFVHQPRALLVFTEDEVKLLMRCSHLHYDFACQQVGLQGGFLYGMSVACPFDGKADRDLTFREIDMLCKVLEFPPQPDEMKCRELRHQLVNVLSKLTAETERLNKRSK